MNYAIENEKLKVIVSTLGAELQSIYGKTTSFEYLWQGDENYWRGKATNVFPICGRLWEDQYTHKGKTYELPCHGFAKFYEFDVVTFSRNKIVLKLTDSDKIKKVYPFSFAFTVTYTLKGNVLKTEYQVENTGRAELPFSLGGHPGFNLPLGEGIAFDEHYLEFENKCKPKKLNLSKTCFYTGKSTLFKLNDGKVIPLSHSMFDDDAIFLTGMDTTITLKSDKTDRYVKLTYPEMPHVGFWHTPKTEAPFICIEPWNGVPGLNRKIEDTKDKTEFTHLPSGKVYNNYFDIEVNE